MDDEKTQLRTIRIKNNDDVMFTKFCMKYKLSFTGLTRLSVLEYIQKHAEEASLKQYAGMRSMQEMIKLDDECIKYTLMKAFFKTNVLTKVSRMMSAGVNKRDIIDFLKVAIKKAEKMKSVDDVDYFEEVIKQIRHDKFYASKMDEIRHKVHK